MDLLPNSYIMFLQNPSTSEDQRGTPLCDQRVAKRNTQNLTGNNSTIQEYNRNTMRMAMIRHFKRFSFSTFQLNVKQFPYQNKTKDNTDNK